MNRLVNASFVLVAAAALSLTGCAPRPSASTATAPVAPPPFAVARTIDVEISDSVKGGAPRTLLYQLACVDGRGWSKLETGDASEKVALEAQSERGREGGPAVVSLQVARMEAGGPDLKVSQSVIFFAGRRTVVGHLARRDGGVTEIAMITR